MSATAVTRSSIVAGLSFPPISIRGWIMNHDASLLHIFTYVESHIARQEMLRVGDISPESIEYLAGFDFVQNDELF